MLSNANRFLIVTSALCLLLTANGHSVRSQTSQEAKRRKVASLRKLPPVRGVLFHCCSCAVPCPCMFNAKDVEGCNIVRIYHITDGGYAGKKLAGLTAVFVPHPEELKKKEGGLRQDGKPVDAVLYLSTVLSKQQENDFLGLLAENNLGTVFNNVLRRRAPIVFRKLADGYDIDIANAFHAKTQIAKGKDGKQIVVDNLSLDEGPRWYLGRSVMHDYQDSDEKDWHWNLPKSNGSWAFFAWGPHIDPSDEHEAHKK